MPMVGLRSMTDEQVGAMTTTDKAQAFIEGRYAASFTRTGGPPGGISGVLPVVNNQPTSGGPNIGTIACAGSGTNSSNCSSFADMAASYAADIAEIEAGDEYRTPL